LQSNHGRSKNRKASFGAGFSSSDGRIRPPNLVRALKKKDEALSVYKTLLTIDKAEAQKFYAEIDKQK